MNNHTILINGVCKYLNKSIKLKIDIEMYDMSNKGLAWIYHNNKWWTKKRNTNANEIQVNYYIKKLWIIWIQKKHPNLHAKHKNETKHLKWHRDGCLNTYYVYTKMCLMNFLVLLRILNHSWHITFFWKDEKSIIIIQSWIERTILFICVVLYLFIIMGNVLLWSCMLNKWL